MRSGLTLVETLLACTVLGLMAAVAVPSVRHSVDRLAVQRAGAEFVRFYREARLVAVRRAAPVRVRLEPDSLVGTLADTVVLHGRGPRAFGVQLTVTRSELAFGPSGLAWGPANTRVTLRRGTAVDEYVTSRVGRLRRVH